MPAYTRPLWFLSEPDGDRCDYGLNMLIRATPGGDVFTMREYRIWSKDAAFGSLRTIPAPSPSPLILATSWTAYMRLVAALP